MNSLWNALDELPTGSGVASTWQHYVGEAWPAFQAAFLDPLDEPAASCCCPRECGCAHRVVHHDDGRIVAVCECDPWNCDNIPLTAADVVDWEFSRSRLARALCRAFDLERRDQQTGLPGTQHIATFSAAAIPVILTVQQTRHDFRQVVAELASIWREGFILFAPTSRFVDGRIHELLSHARAKCFDLASHITLMPEGTLRAHRRAGDLFSQFVTRRDDGATESEAVRLFAFMKSLGTDDTNRNRKAPLERVFRLLVLEGASQEEAARKCQCSPGLLSLRVTEIERQLKIPLAHLRTLATAQGGLAVPEQDPRARTLRRHALTNTPDDNEW